MERSRQWAIRCCHEASLYERNCFVTLTYNDEHLPPDLSLNVSDYQRFLKRLKSAVRRRYGPETAKGIRFYMCGEYGDQYGRPHYHLLLFNWDFEDKKLWQELKSGSRIYRSAFLESLWPYGYSSIGDVTFQSAAYVARYIMKKRLGKDADQYYEWVDQDGVIHDRKPEFTNMSRASGIGKGWLERFQSDVYPGDFIVMNNKKMRPPKYYDQQFELHSPNDFVKLKRIRRKRAQQHSANNTPERRKVREKIQNLKLDKLKRTLK